MELKQLYQQIIEEESIQKKLNEYDLQRKELVTKLNELYQLFEKEQKDVERLENVSLTSFFYEILGNKEEKLDKERKEAYEVKMKINSYEYQLDSIIASIQSYEDKLNNISTNKEKYESLLSKKKELLKDLTKVNELENKISDSYHQQKEINEAYQEANKALSVCDKLLDKLDEANGIATYDVFVKGGVISHMMKYDAIDKAQEYVDQLQVQLNKLKTELVDIKITDKIEISIDSWDRTLDYWFDNIFTDFSIKERLTQAMDQANNTKNKIKLIIQELNKMKKIEQENEKNLKTELERMIVEA